MQNTLTQPIDSLTKRKGNKKNDTLHTHKSQSTEASEHFPSVTSELFGSAV
jgi:hypothetical protein